MFAILYMWKIIKKRFSHHRRGAGSTRPFDARGRSSSEAALAAGGRPGGGRRGRRLGRRTRRKGTFRRWAHWNPPGKSCPRNGTQFLNLQSQILQYFYDSFWQLYFI